ncbi:MAG: HIT domain-containing protein [Bacteroidetes bacterium]|nr:HIT domain-containing protein [Bacteroidota bacterium]MBT7577810.1 HIT domain-containing protein [Candidatus Neomarinimicrobiota bacterium]
MIKRLLETGGISHQDDIAKAILQYDEAQLEYYINITNNMVGKVLRSHAIVEKDKKRYSLPGYDTLTKSQISELVALCDQKIGEYIAKRGDKIWAHRNHAEGYISGTVRYEVFKRAKSRCELCGIPSSEKALEVDHIIPRNSGGSDDITNLQALCYSCNAMKRDRDDTDFREIRESYNHRQDDCLFCNIENSRIVTENELAYAIRDGFPVTDLHTLIIPKRHVSDYFGLVQPEVNSTNLLISNLKAAMEKNDKLITGFNIGTNSGQSAGQTIFHCHIHLIPRRDGDVEKPRGGIRHTIPGRGEYLS